jgi:cytochrome c-type biogenesis protein CcmH/NrfG
VYRLGTRLGDRRAIAQRLNVDEAAVTAAERTVRRALQTEGKEWWALTSWEGAPAISRCDRAELVAAHAERRLSPTDAEALAAHVATCPACAEQQAFLAEADTAGGIAPTVAAPTWVNRQVMDADGDAPEPQTAGDSWRRKVFAQPDWLSGLAVGAVATTLVLMVLIPQLEYQKAVREPGDVLIARGYQPLEPKVAAQLSEARALLAKNRTDPAIQNLKAVLAARPENQEARWLLATTYDRLGDQYQAAQQYEIFVDTEQRERAIVDDRLKRAQSKLDGWKEVP